MSKWVTQLSGSIPVSLHDTLYFSMWKENWLAIYNKSWIQYDIDITMQPKILYQTLQELSNCYAWTLTRLDSKQPRRMTYGLLTVVPPRVSVPCIHYKTVMQFPMWPLTRSPLAPYDTVCLTFLMITYAPTRHDIILWRQLTSPLFVVSSDKLIISLSIRHPFSVYKLHTFSLSISFLWVRRHPSLMSHKIHLTFHKFIHNIQLSFQSFILIWYQLNYNSSFNSYINVEFTKQASHAIP